MQIWEQTYQLQPGGAVRVAQEHGAMCVTGWDQPTVKLTATARGNGSAMDLTVGQDARGLTVEAGVLDLVLYVPAGTACDIESDSGDVTISDVSGSVAVEVGSGSVRAERVQGRKLTVEAGGGALHLTGLAVDHLDAETGHGDVHIELAEVRPSGSYSIETGSGGVVVAVPAHAGIELDVETGAGMITYTGLDLRVRHAEPGELGATLNHGGATLNIETGSGNVQVRPAAAPEAVIAPDTVTAPEPQARILAAVQGDAALANSDQVQRILTMVAQGKLSPAEAEAILTALDEEETPA